MRPKSLILLFLALGCGLVASIGISQVMKNKGDDTSADQRDKIPVLVALNYIPMGTEITSDLVKLERWPKELIPEGIEIISDIKDIEGRNARALIAIGTPIHKSMLIGAGEGTSSAIELIPKGYRVIAVKVSLDSGANLLQAGDRVDMMVYVKRSFASGGSSKTVAKTFLTDIKVFAINNQYTRSNDKDEEAVAARTISLLVTPQQAEKITLAGNLGKIRLTMRHINDHDEVLTEGVTAADLLNGGKGDPDKEIESANSVATKDDTNNKSGSSLTDFLNNNQNNQSGQPAVTTPIETENKIWVMEVINAGDVTEVQFDGDKPVRNQYGPSTTTPPAVSSSDGGNDNGSDNGSDDGSDDNDTDGDQADADGPVDPDN